jgi:hypothetical protein
MFVRYSSTLLEFRLHEMKLGSLYYILLPKMNSLQVRLLEKRLSSKGFTTVTRGSRKPRRVVRPVHLDPEGLCWASFEISDAVAPALPEILSAPKEAVPMSELLAKYFRAARSDEGLVVRMKTRVESGPTWDWLRESGECALTPDEHAIACHLLLSARGPCDLVTDFPVEGSRLRIRGRKLYYDSRLAPESAKETLRSAGKKGTRNSYLPKDSILALPSAEVYPMSDYSDLLESLGEWCYFRPTSRKRSN